MPARAVTAFALLALCVVAGCDDRTYREHLARSEAWCTPEMVRDGPYRSTAHCVEILMVGHFGHTRVR